MPDQKLFTRACALRNPLSRRDFLKVGLLSLATIAAGRRPPTDDRPSSLLLGRVAAPVVYLYSQPEFRSKRTGKRTRDQLLTILEETVSPAGPQHNPLWYRTPGGYTHSGSIQRIHYMPPNPIPHNLPPYGQLGEVTVPYTRAYRYTRSGGWGKLYRLYFSTLHWITSIDEGPDGSPWARIQDYYPLAEYHAPASHFRLVAEEVFSPISTDVPPEDKRIDVSIGSQTLTASEVGKVVFTTKISSGIHTEHVPEGEIPTDTPIGSFHIQLKLPSRHMGDGHLTSDYTSYELPGVPWTSVFHEHGIALHGTYWHNNFGYRMSHGCVNLRNADALRLFRWTTPVFTPGEYYVQGSGTLMVVRE